MRTRRRLHILLAAATLVATALAAAPANDRAIPVVGVPWTGDFDAMLERRVIRVLVPPSRTLYFPDRGQEKGLTAELARDFENWINRTYKTRLKRRPVTVALIPTPRDRLLPDLAAGLGDIAAGNLTVTDERLALADFYTPADAREVSELVLTGPKSASVASESDLAGRTVHVRPSSSYHESLVALNARLVAAGRAPVKIVVVPEALEDEDMMEMLNAGLFDVIVVDDWKARMWVKVLPDVRVNEGVKLRTGGRVGWAMRRNSPQLRAAFESFYVNFARKQGVLEYRLAMYNKKVRQLQDPTGREDWKRFQETVALFEKYGTQYGFDPLLLVAQGYQESRLDQSARGPTGAVGIMQVMPATGTDLKVGDITITENNIHAGVKYMETLHRKYFPEPEISDLNRSLMCFAAYNAGPARIASMRRTAVERGLDPNVWFNHVELVVAEKIGRETTTYVRNIYKYYVSYLLIAEAEDARRRARESVSPGDARQE